MNGEEDPQAVKTSIAMAIHVRRLRRVCCCVLVPVAANAANLLCPWSMSLSGCGARGGHRAAAAIVLLQELQDGTWDGGTCRIAGLPDAPTRPTRGLPQPIDSWLTAQHSLCGAFLSFL